MVNCTNFLQLVRHPKICHNSLDADQRYRFVRGLWFFVILALAIVLISMCLSFRLRYRPKKDNSSSLTDKLMKITSSSTTKKSKKRSKKTKDVQKNTALTFSSTEEGIKLHYADQFHLVHERNTNSQVHDPVLIYTGVLANPLYYQFDKNLLHLMSYPDIETRVLVSYLIRLHTFPVHTHALPRVVAQFGDACQVSVQNAKWNIDMLTQEEQALLGKIQSKNFKMPSAHRFFAHYPEDSENFGHSNLYWALDLSCLDFENL